MPRRLLVEWCLIAAITLGIVASLQSWRVTERLDNVVYDLLVGLRAPSASDRIMLVTIDEPSVARIGRWPWPRTVHAAMLDRLAAIHPAAVAYDVLFTEPAAGDGRLAAAIGRLGNVALPVEFEAPGLNGRAIDATPPVAPLAEAARALGHVALLPDSEGVARSIPLTLRASGREWPHLMEQTYRIATGHPSGVFRKLHAKRLIGARIPFQPSSGAFRTIPFASVLAGDVPADFLRNRILLVGATASGLGDRYRVPTRTGALVSGIEVQANLLNSLLAGRVITTPGNLLLVFLSLLLPLGLLVSFWWLRPSRALTVSLALIAVTLLFPALLLALADYWIPPVATLVGLLIAYPLWGWRRLQAVDRAMSQELALFSAEPIPVSAAPRGPSYLDPIGGQTARLRAAIASMRDLRRLVTDAIDSVNDPFLVTDLENRVVLTNHAANSLLVDHAAEGVPLDRLAAELGISTAEIEDGSRDTVFLGERAYSPRRFPLCDHMGERRGWILHLVDISDIRRAQSEREEALEFLSHDMRSPQTSILTLLEAHRHSIQDRTLAARIAGLARKTLNLADTFVHLARLSVASFAPEDVELGDVLTEAADELWPAASRRNVRIEIDGTEEPYFVEGERETLSRALINLLDNAVKFSPDGGTVHCSIGYADGMIQCTIADAGPGVPPERRGALFSRFGHREQAAGSGISAGLGLAYVSTAVIRHGGTIEYQPAEPTGARFILRFRAAD